MVVGVGGENPAEWDNECVPDLPAQETHGLEATLDGISGPDDDDQSAAAASIYVEGEEGIFKASLMKQFFEHNAVTISKDRPAKYQQLSSVSVVGQAPSGSSASAEYIDSISQPMLAVFKLLDGSYVGTILELPPGCVSSKAPAHFMSLAPAEAHDSGAVMDVHSLTSSHFFQAHEATQHTHQLVVHQDIQGRLVKNAAGNLCWQWQGEDLLAMVESLLRTAHEEKLIILMLSDSKVKALNLPHASSDGFKILVDNHSALPDGTDSITSGSSAESAKDKVRCELVGCGVMVKLSSL